MKKILAVSLILASSAVTGVRAEITSQVFTGDYIYGLSTNGEWTIGILDDTFSIFIENLKTGQRWDYVCDDADFGDKYSVATGLGVSDNGVVIGTLNELPAYWFEGKWNLLETMGSNGSCKMGSITPDGSLIVGGIGAEGLNMDDKQMTFPVIWRRLDNGTYGDPEFLPNPSKDITGANPQYMSCLVVSEDGKTIGAQMTSNYGFPHIPYIYTLDDNGQWKYQMVGEDLINPDHLEFPPLVGEYRGLPRPNFEEYMTEEEIEEMFAAFPAWSRQMEREGFTPEQIEILLLEFVEQFMSEPDKSVYTDLVNAYLAEYLEWEKNYGKYEQTLAQMLTDGMDFIFNNMLISPDGKYLYSTGTRNVLARPDDPENPFDSTIQIVRFDVATGEAVEYSAENNIVASCVTADYSVLGQPMLPDPYMYREAYIYPQGATEPTNIRDYFAETGKQKIVTWMEDNMLKEVISLSPSGTSIIIIDAYSIGMPTATPDMSMFTFSTSADYWSPQVNYTWCSYLLNTADFSGVETVTGNPDASLKVKKGGIIELSVPMVQLSVYDLSGVSLYQKENASGRLSTGLDNGVYIINAVTESGENISVKALF